MNTAKMTYTKAQGILKRYEQSPFKLTKTNEVIQAEIVVKEYKSIGPIKEPKKQKNYNNSLYFKNENFEITCPLVYEIASTVSKYFNLTLPEIYSVNELGKLSRKIEFVIPRQIIHYICKNRTTLPLIHIGRNTGGVDHSTVINSIQKIDYFMFAKKTDSMGKIISKQVTEILAMLRDEMEPEINVNNIAQL